ncbi:hypothetical protein MPSEU_000451200 [Mayamaea pseudoterrestris]|nr:hypothetical protein MPSEU_000451200 [Mayamaea pseudoterrestris]
MNLLLKQSLVALLCVVAAAATEPEQQRNLRRFDLFDPALDVCSVGQDADGYPIFDSCDTTQFPVCTSDELICYNRKPMRSKFYVDNRQPYYFIEYSSVYCYPSSWGGCSSCTPGRYCLSESRCILDDSGYPCAQWI